jgi:hypothetical protein
MMAGLKRITDQNRFRNQAVKVAEKILGDANPMMWAENKPDDAYEDDGALHVTKHGLHVVFGIGQDTPGKEANETMRTILTGLGMKRMIGDRVLVMEQCEECDGEGTITCDLDCEHDCDTCDGTGLVPPSLTSTT